MFFVFKLFSLIYILFCVTKCQADDILGCGGFVKSHVGLDFSKIEIALYSKEGILKEKTECAPTNGYYFLPLYETGDYLLKVHPPPGWSFAPSEVELAVDGVTDQCSTGQDVNFIFNGFGITGRVVTAGQQEGPAGINIELRSENGESRHTITTKKGDFHFTPVIPGKYVVKAGHAKWKLEPSQTTVTVKEGNTAIKVGSLSVRGYEVSGTVTVDDSDNPVPGIYVLLYSKQENLKYRIEGCQTALLQGVPDAPLCYSVTDESGEFTFGLVPAGGYYLRTLHTTPGNQHTFQIKPETVDFTVLHDPLHLPGAFVVTGVTVVGLVEASIGTPLGGARVILNGAGVAVTDAKGKFTLPNMLPGTYKLHYQHEHCEVEDSQLRISASCHVLMTAARARSWRVCGTVRAAAETGVRTVRLLLGDKERQATHDADGNWCMFLPSGVYIANVQVSEQERRDGLQFYPITQKVSVAHGPVSGISFSQLKATLSGTVTCLDPKLCDKLPITLRPLSPEGTYVGKPTVTYAKDGLYSFSEVLPGSVEVSVSTGALCWEEERSNVAVSVANAKGPNLVQKGYVLVVKSSHDTEIDYESQSDRGTWSVKAGTTEKCVAKAEMFTLTPRGCHLMEPSTAKVRSGSDQTASFKATSHAAVITVLSPEAVKDLVLTIEENSGPRTTDPLIPTKHPDGGYGFEYTIYLKQGTACSVWVQSSSLLFSPPSPQRLVGGGACLPRALVVRARPALTIAGKTVPAVAGATVVLTSDGIFQKQITGADGKYSFGPLDASVNYIVTAEKESYVFGLRDSDGNIPAHKLAEIHLVLRDEATNEPLQGALVSVSGGEYRRNVVSGEDGTLKFPSLAPAEYYIKPLMKEYRFTPPNNIVKLGAGEHKSLTLKGIRIAWSAFGSVRWVGAGGVRGASVRATGGTAGLEATTDSKGDFRIRGLLPNIEYALELKETPELPGLKLLQGPEVLKVTQGKDIENLLLIALQPHHLTDINVLIKSSNLDHYKTLKLKLSPEDSPTSTVYTTKIDSAGLTEHNNPGVLYPLPRLPADNKSYVMVLDSNLSRNTHSFEPVTVYLTADGKCQNYVIYFVAKVKTTDQELGRSSLLFIPVLLLLALAYHHRASLPTPRWPAPRGPAPRPQKPQAPAPLDTDTIQRIVNAVNAVGKKGSKKHN